MALKDLDIIEDLKPIGGGWRYMQLARDGSFHRVPVTGGAPTARKLVEMVRQYRINEGINMGDPERDIADYIRKVSPNNDRFRGKGGVLGRPRAADYVPPIQRIREWVDSMSPRKPRLVGIEEATPRAQACIGCPQNIRWKTPCGECNEAVDYAGYTMRGLAVYELDEALHGCRLHGIHLPSAIFIDRDDLPPRVPTAPAYCWLPEPNETHH